MKESNVNEGMRSKSEIQHAEGKLICGTTHGTNSKLSLINNLPLEERSDKYIFKPLTVTSIGLYCYTNIFVYCQQPLSAQNLGMKEVKLINLTPMLQPC